MSTEADVLPDTMTGPLVLIPVYDDWMGLALLLAELDRVLIGSGTRAEVLVVDDGSTTDRGDRLSQLKLTAINISVLVLKRNLGHQRAIAIGLCYVEDQLDAHVVIVMDGDGEDDPADVPKLLAAHRREPSRIVFAERTKRSESVLFRVFYALFRLLHLLLIGRDVRVGNFSVIPRVRLESLVVVSELWNHYAAAAFKSRQPLSRVPTVRARRLSGRSTMDFVGLVVHGLSAISVYSEIVGVRLMLLCLFMSLGAFAGLIVAAYIRLFTSLSIPGWAPSAIGLLAVVLLQSMSLACFFSFVILAGRNSLTTLPKRDYRLFIRCLEPIRRTQ